MHHSLRLNKIPMLFISKFSIPIRLSSGIAASMQNKEIFEYENAYSRRINCLSSYEINSKTITLATI